MSKIARIYALSASVSNALNLGQKYCQPATMCTWNGGANRCQCNASGPYASFCSQINPAGQTICDWSVKDLDCPAQGCPAFQVTFPASCTGGQTEKCFVANDTNHRPTPISFDFTMDPYWNNEFNLENVETA